METKNITATTTAKDGLELEMELAVPSPLNCKCCLCCTPKEYMCRDLESGNLWGDTPYMTETSRRNSSWHWC